ncbi:MAG: hypothetical protein HDS26_04115 [Bacteroides sp.]|nr:hypothetical protein [Bacteroides sp.]
MKVQEMDNYFDSIARCLDSIAIYEDMLIPVINPETKQRYSKAEIRRRLSQLGELIANQKAKIASLSEALSKRNDSVKTSGILTTIEHLRTQLGEKEQRINNLVRELEGRNIDVRRMSGKISALENELSSSKSQNEALASAVIAQTEVLNEGYILVGTKKHLQELGVLSKGGIFKKSKYQPNNINTSMCQKVDISVVRSLPLSSKNPKILTAAPSGSYHIDANGETSVLHIDNPHQFWSISSVLIVQL